MTRPLAILLFLAGCAIGAPILAQTPTNAAPLTGGGAFAIAEGGARVKMQPAPDAIDGVFLRAGRMIETDGCADGWCRIRGGGGPGWVPEAALIPKSVVDAQEALRQTEERERAAARRVEERAAMEARRAQRLGREAAREEARLEAIDAGPWSAAVKEAAKNEEVLLGMPADALLLSWGSPQRVNTTVSAAARREQWVYGSSYVYVVNGIVESWQTSR